MRAGSKKVKEKPALHLTTTPRKVELNNCVEGLVNHAVVNLTKIQTKTAVAAAATLNHRIVNNSITKLLLNHKPTNKK